MDKNVYKCFRKPEILKSLPTSKGFRRSVLWRSFRNQFLSRSTPYREYRPLDDIRPRVNTRLTKDPANAIIIAPWNRYNASRGEGKKKERKIVSIEGNMHGNGPKMWIRRSSGGRASTANTPPFIGFFSHSRPLSFALWAANGRRKGCHCRRVSQYKVMSCLIQHKGRERTGTYQG